MSALFTCFPLYLTLTFTVTTLVMGLYVAFPAALTFIVFAFFFTRSSWARMTPCLSSLTSPGVTLPPFRLHQRRDRIVYHIDPKTMYHRTHKKRALPGSPYLLLFCSLKDLHSRPISAPSKGNPSFCPSADFRELLPAVPARLCSRRP